MKQVENGRIRKRTVPLLKEEHERIRKRTVPLLAGVMYMVSIGVLYIWSVVRRVIELEWGWTATQSGLPFSVGIVCFATGNLIGGRLQLKLPARLVGTIGGFLTGAGFVLCGFAGDAPLMVALFFGGVTGLGVGLGYSSYLPTVLRWYAPDRKGFVSGWIIGGFGVTPLYLAPLASFLIDRYGIQVMFMSIGVMTMVISMVLAQFIKVPEQRSVEPVSVMAEQGSEAVEKPRVDMTSRQMMATKEFYILFLMFLCSVSIGQMVIGNVTGIVALQAGVTDAAVLAMLVSFVALANVGGRITGGVLSDRIGRMNTLLLVFIIQLINMVGFGFYGNMPMLVTGIMLAGFCFGMTLGVYPAITVDRFGQRYYSSNYGIMYMAFGCAGIAAPLIAGYFFDKNGNYDIVYFICAIGMAVMVGFSLLLKFMRRFQTREDS